MCAGQFYAREAIPGAEEAQLWPASNKLLDQLEVRRVILDVEDSARSCGLPGCQYRGGRGAGAFEDQHRLGARLQFEPKDASGTHHTFHSDYSAHQSNQLFGDDQADARTFLDSAFLSQTIKRLK